MTRTALALPLVLALLGGCAGKSAGETSDDIVEIMRDEAPIGDFIAMFSNRPTFLVNGDLPADRRNVIGARLKRLGCRDPRLIRERAEEQEGTWSFGRKRMLYLSEWKCA